MNSESTEDEPAVDVSQATDSEAVRRSLPSDIQDELTDAAFGPGGVRELIRDTYYLGPIGIGRGGWVGAFANGLPGTQLRRPNGALYNYPRSWRYTTLERGLKTGIIQYVGGGRFCATERGVAVLNEIDRCHDCDKQRVPMVKHTRYVGNPNTEGSVESHGLVTACPDCGSTGYDYGTAVTSYEEFTRDDERVRHTVDEWLSDHPQTRTYGGPRTVADSAVSQDPDVDEDAIATLLDRVVEDHTSPTPRELLSPIDEDLYGRDVVTVSSDGRFYEFYGTDQAVVVGRTDTEGDIHITDDGNGRLRVGMSYELAVKKGLKDRLHHETEDASWTGDYWTVAADRLSRVLSKLTVGVTDTPQYERGGTIYPGDGKPMADNLTYLDVTVTGKAISQVSTRLLGITVDGDLA